MKYDVTRPIINLEGKQIEDGEKKKCTFKSIFVTALMSPDPKNEDRIKKLGMFTLAQKLFKAEKEVDLKADEVVLIKDVVNQGYPSPLITGLVEEFFEGAKPALEAVPAN